MYLWSIAQPCLDYCFLRTQTCICNRAGLSDLAKVLKKNGDVLFTGKAYNNRVVPEWLAAKLRDLLASGVWTDPRTPSAAAMMMLGCTWLASLQATPGMS